MEEREIFAQKLTDSELYQSLCEGFQFHRFSVSLVGKEIVQIDEGRTAQFSISNKEPQEFLVGELLPCLNKWMAKVIPHQLRSEGDIKDIDLDRMIEIFDLVRPLYVTRWSNRDHENSIAEMWEFCSRLERLAYELLLPAAEIELYYENDELRIFLDVLDLTYDVPTKFICSPVEDKVYLDSDISNLSGLYRCLRAKILSMMGDIRVSNAVEVILKDYYREAEEAECLLLIDVDAQMVGLVKARQSGVDFKHFAFSWEGLTHAAEQIAAYRADLGSDYVSKKGRREVVREALEAIGFYQYQLVEQGVEVSFGRTQ